MEWYNGIYYGLCVGLWVVLAGLGIASLIPGFAAWLGQRPKMMILFLGIDRMPEKPVSTLRRMYVYLALGWSWLMSWSWWIMPALKNVIYHDVASLKAMHIARISMLILLVTYSVFGFFCISKALKIWFKEIYNRPNV